MQSWFVYVEPVPELYSRIDALVENMGTRLAELDLLTDSMEVHLDTFSRLLSLLRTHAEWELEGVERSHGDMRSLGGYHDWLTSLYGDRSKTVVVSDVHTDPNTYTCLQEGVALSFIVVAVPFGDGHIATVGVVFEHYEFVRSLSDGRLTDEEWKGMLEDGTAPEPASWFQDFNP